MLKLFQGITEGLHCALCHLLDKRFCEACGQALTNPPTAGLRNALFEILTREPRPQTKMKKRG